MENLTCTGCGKKLTPAEVVETRVMHSDTYSGTTAHCAACAKICDEDNDTP